MSRVFVIERSKHDVLTTSAYGEIVILFPNRGDRPSIWRTAECGERVLAELRRHRFDPSMDFIVLCGSMLAVSVAVAVVAAEYGEFNALAFNAHSDARDYEPVTLGVKESRCLTK